MAIVYNVLLFIGLLLGIVFLHDILQRKHTILRNFPVVGHIRYLFELIGPELRQYWVATDKEETPFNRSERSWVYATAKKQNNNFGFGTTEILYETGYPILKQATFPFPDNKKEYFAEDRTLIPCAKLIGESHGRAKPYRPLSIINISAMSYGSLGKNAISALNLGSKQASCYHNTGEGGVSPYHQLGGELVWQIGTGYFGARNEAGDFDLTKLANTVAQEPSVKMIEFKLSQGAKPGKGGILPKAKISAEISRIRGIAMGQDCISPNTHTAFSNVDELIDLIERIAKETGLPVGIKSAVGKLDFWQELAEKMKSRRQGPDFIAIDGGEGGTGAAPLAFADHVSLPFKIGFKRVYKIFKDMDMVNDVTWIGSAKLGFPDRAIVAFAMGCDMINIAREAMLAIGCIQAQKCHTDHCPAGVATQNRRLERGLVIDDKAVRFGNFVQGLRKEILQLTHACGYEHPCQLSGADVEFSSGINQFSTLDEVLGYKKVPVPFAGMKTLFSSPPSSTQI